MLWRCFSVVAAIISSGCLHPDTDQACKDMCSQLVTECKYEAYPDLDSCLQGCGYEVSQGVPVTWMAECTAEAGCDPFALLECQHTYGQE